MIGWALSVSSRFALTMPIEILLKGHTINGAYQLRMEDEIGSIELGKAADFVVLEEDMMDVEPYMLHMVKQDAVVLQGQLVQGDI
jgi:predicted amidohydrolase YtcJ